ncbi:MAG: hypothetical protein IJ131_05235 [Eggerthellaceae bacterium]|nr:hypothetical protein [Eggerthellaceae bacterium]
MPAFVEAPQVNMHDAKTNLSRMAKEIEEGLVPYYIVARHGHPVLKISLYEPEKPKRRLGVAKGKFECPDDDVFFGRANDEIAGLFEEYL